MSIRWFTSDQHFGHRNIIGYSCRPYVDSGGEPDVAWMNTDLVVRHNMCVARGDEVWMLGDLVMGDKDEGLELVRECVGRKTLVCGNHDKCFRKGGRAAPGWDGRYAMEGGLKAVLHGTVELVLGDGRHVLLSHFPYVGDSGDEERYVSHKPVDDGRWLLHGHVHERWRQRGRQISEATRTRPRSRRIPCCGQITHGTDRVLQVLLIRMAGRGTLAEHLPGAELLAADQAFRWKGCHVGLDEQVAAQVQPGEPAIPALQ